MLEWVTERWLLSEVEVSRSANYQFPMTSFTHFESDRVLTRSSSQFLRKRIPC